MSRLAVLLLLVLSFAALQAHGRVIELVRSDAGDHNDTVDVTGEAANGACNYHFEVQTANVDFAGTDSYITFELYNKDGYGIRAGIDGSGAFSGKFEQGRLDTFDVNGVGCVPHPCRLILKSDGRGIAPDWLCSWIRVTVSGAIADQKVFHVNQWIGGYSPPQADINYCYAARVALDDERTMDE